MPSERVNVADRLTAAAASAGARQQAVVARSRRGERMISFAQLEADASALARGLMEIGVRPGTRLALLVPPSPEFVALVFALLRSGATTILIDPGMGRKHLVDCLAAAEPEGLIAISKAQALRTVMRRRFPRAKLNVTVGPRWFWGGVTYQQLLERGRAAWSRPRDNAPSAPHHGHDGGPSRPCHALPATHGDDPAAIIFTSGSTGPPKGVLYTHRMFDAQASDIQRAYDIKPGGADLACFALFGLFNAAWGVTTVFPHMDFSRPASADPLELLAAADLHRVTQAFASPAIWDKLSRHCETTGVRIPSLRKVFSCGAPVPATTIHRTLQYVVAPGAEMHTPYGATEALPVATIEAKEILGETAAATSKGAGICVGRRFDGIEWRVIRITDHMIAKVGDAVELPRGEIGELIVRGPQVSPQYEAHPAPSPGRRGLGRGADAGAGSNLPSLTLSLHGGPDDSSGANALAKIADGATTWHRMGDVGYLDAQNRFWYCGRKSHRVESRGSSCFSAPVEEIFNAHPRIRRSALVRCDRSGDATPLLVVELVAHDPHREASRADDQLVAELRTLRDAHALHNETLKLLDLDPVLIHPEMPVDVRHNAKINREALAAWAARRLAGDRVRNDPAR
ncbi:MAG TPA: fatty acid CoA ligase family protein [Lacipirellulaceae bacterium]|nr:fatty acid CoA ligase family protein [Lacipirellulaceae bacterium]